MDEATQLAHQGGVGVVAVYLIQWLKVAKWFPWLNLNTETINRWVGIIVAVATSIGVKWVATGSSAEGWHIVLDVPNLKTLMDTAVHAAAQFGGQQLLYYAGGVQGMGVKKAVVKNGA